MELEPVVEPWKAKQLHYNFEAKENGLKNCSLGAKKELPVENWF